MSINFENAYKTFGKVKYLGMLISGFSVLIMMFYVFADVLLRNFSTTGSLYTYEVTSHYFMPLIVFPGLAFTFSEGMMPRIDFILEKAKSMQFQRIITTVLIILEIFLMILLAYFGFRYAINAFSNGLSFTAGGTNYTTWPVIILGSIGFAMVIIEMIFVLIKNLKSQVPTFTVIKKEDIL